jgi:hypothetical protein
MQPSAIIGKPSPAYDLALRLDGSSLLNLTRYEMAGLRFDAACRAKRKSGEIGAVGPKMALDPE